MTPAFSEPHDAERNIDASQPSGAYLEKRLFDGRSWWVLVTWIFIAAAFLRLYALDLKPLHHDEGVNGLFLTNMIRASTAFRYNPGNYHGPTLFDFAWVSTKAFGLTTAAVRFVPALFGLLTVGLVLALRRRIGDIGALSAAALLSVSPGSVYYSRYFIHETLLACFILGLVVAFERFWETRRVPYLALGAVSAGLMFATKETALISACVLACSVFATLLLVGRTLRTAYAELGTRCGGRTRLLFSAITAIVAFVAVEIAFYTSLFSNREGLTDAVRSFNIWANTGTRAHVHGWTAYLSWLVQEESAVLVLGALGVGLAVWCRDNGFAVFLALWSLGTLAAYSLVPYKTPWLTINIIVPLAIIGGYAVQLIHASLIRRVQKTGMLALAILIAISGYQAAVLNFVRYDDERYPYVYAHTRREVLTLVSDVNRLFEQSNGRIPFSIAIVSPDHFPLSWYFRYYRTGFYGHVVSTDAPVVIARERQAKDVNAILGERYKRLDSYPLRPGVRLVLYVRRDVG
jgi:uncharacterized protein (TIGR03663 family)